jgi:hypothetical protein
MVNLSGWVPNGRMVDDDVVRLDRIEEFEFSSDHPDVLSLTKWFQKRADLSSLFLGVRAASRRSNVFSSLMSSPFFRIHRVVENEHIRLSIAKYLHFCRTVHEKNRFIGSFDIGVQFWRAFWGESFAVFLNATLNPLVGLKRSKSSSSITILNYFFRVESDCLIPFFLHCIAGPMYCVKK